MHHVYLNVRLQTSVNFEISTQKCLFCCSSDSHVKVLFMQVSLNWNTPHSRFYGCKCFCLQMQAVTWLFSNPKIRSHEMCFFFLSQIYHCVSVKCIANRYLNLILCLFLLCEHQEVTGSFLKEITAIKWLTLSQK